MMKRTSKRAFSKSRSDHGLRFRAKQKAATR